MPLPLFALLLASASSLPYFHVFSNSRERCFVEPDLLANYTLLIRYGHIDNPGVDCMIKIKHKNKLLHSKDVGLKDSVRPDVKQPEVPRLGYLVPWNGDFEVCVSCDDPKGKKGSWRLNDQTPLKWFLNIDQLGNSLEIVRPENILKDSATQGKTETT
jgi:hypothetical protein